MVAFAQRITYDPDGTAYSDASKLNPIPALNKPAGGGPYDVNGSPVSGNAVPAPGIPRAAAAAPAPTAISSANEQALPLPTAGPTPTPTATGPAAATASPTPDEILASSAGSDPRAIENPDSLVAKATGETPRVAQPAGSNLRNIRFQSQRPRGF